jgi:hypothetical protein
MNNMWEDALLQYKYIILIKICSLLALIDKFQIPLSFCIH